MVIADVAQKTEGIWQGNHDGEFDGFGPLLEADGIFLQVDLTGFNHFKQCYCSVGSVVDAILQIWQEDLFIYYLRILLVPMFVL